MNQNYKKLEFADPICQSNLNHSSQAKLSELRHRSALLLSSFYTCPKSVADAVRELAEILDDLLAELEQKGESSDIKYGR